MFVSAISTTYIRSSSRLLVARSPILKVSRSNVSRQFSTEPPKKSPSNGGGSSILWQVGIGLGAVGAYIGANFFINKTKESVNEDGDLYPAEDNPGTYHQC